MEANTYVLIRDYKPETKSYSITVEITLRDTRDRETYGITILGVTSAKKGEIPEATREEKKRLATIMEKLLRELAELASEAERAGAEEIASDVVVSYIREVKQRNNIIITQELVPDPGSDEPAIAPRELRERAERLLELLEKLKAREAF